MDNAVEKLYSEAFVSPPLTKDSNVSRHSHCFNIGTVSNTHVDYTI